MFSGVGGSRNLVRLALNATKKNPTQQTEGENHD